MKILFVHNNYGKYSGEESVVNKMSSLFREKGHEVVFFRMTSEGARESLVGKVRGFLCGLYSPKGVRGLREVLLKERPDIVNVHNLYPFISPAALFECKKQGIPVVMTIHNFRLICPTGLFMRNEAPCEYCLGHKNEWGCIKYNCEHSFFKSLGYALRNMVARWSKAYKNCVDCFACITDFQRRKLIEAGFDPQHITVIPNAIDIDKVPSFYSGDYVAFSGRLSTEKGVDLIIEVARRHPEISFKLAGAIRDVYLMNDLPKNVELMGYLKGEELASFYQNARYFVMASKWYEGFPISILEAAKYGKTVIGPNHGGFTEIIGEGKSAIGRLFQPGNVDGLESQVVDLWKNEEECERLGRSAFEKLEMQYSTEVLYVKWMSLMNKVLNHKILE